MKSAANTKCISLSKEKKYKNVQGPIWDLPLLKS